MARSTACGMCGTPRPGAREAGICRPCWDYHLALQAYNTRCAMAAWQRDKPKAQPLQSKELNDV